MTGLPSIADFLSRRCRSLALLTLASAIIPVLFLPGLRFDNSVTMWLDPSSTPYRQYQAFLDRYGSDEFILIVLEMDDPFSDGSLTLQEELAQNLTGVDVVDQVFTLPDYLSAVWSGKSGWKKAGRPKDYLYRFLVGPNQKTVGIYVTLKAHINPQTKQETVLKIDQITKERCHGGIQTHLVGMPVLNAALNQAAQASSTTFLPLALAACVITLAVSLRSIKAMVAVMTSVTITSIWTAGLMAMTGRSLNMITVALPGILCVLALANGIHIASEFIAELGYKSDRQNAMRETLMRLITPAVFTSVTTAVGFGSLALSGIQPIVEIGIYTAIGILISCLCNLTIVPGLLLLLPMAGSKVHRTMTPHWSGWCGDFVSRRKWSVSTLAILATAVFLAGATQLNSESNTLKFFPRNARIVDDYNFVAQHFSGFSTVEIEIESPQDKINETLQTMNAMQREIEKQSTVARIEHLGRLKLFSRELSRSSRGRTIGATKLISKMADQFVARQDERVFLRMSVLVKVTASSKFTSIIECIEQSATDHLPKETSWHLSGIVPLLMNVERQIVRTQTKCFPIAAAIILSMIGLLFQSFRAFMASILPNILPILAILSLMVVLDISLDPATVMIATIAIGISADDTIHFLARYRLFKNNGMNPNEASTAALGEIGRAAVFTSVVAAAGFGILALSEFPPMACFGLLTALTMIMALLADIFILPALCHIVGLWQKESEKSNSL